MRKRVFESPKWRKPVPLAYGNAIDSIGSVASPLLAGFSLATIILVSSNAKSFRWPGAAILVLTIAAVTLIGTVQFAYNARQYLWSGADVLNWWPEMASSSELETLLRDEQAEAFHRWERWASWTRVAYSCGIIALVAGLALALPPKHGSGVQDSLRWIGAGVAFFACAGEASWIIAVSLHRSLVGRRGKNLS